MAANTAAASSSIWPASKRDFMTNPDESAFTIPSVPLPNGEVAWGTGGLTKREYFAAQAMQGLLAKGDWESYAAIAKASVTSADTLIDALNAKPAA
jgi:hypothetical protein